MNKREGCEVILNHTGVYCSSPECSKGLMTSNNSVLITQYLPRHVDANINLLSY